MTIGISTYLIYLALSIALTIWVARTLHKNGRVFLVDVFHGNETLADSVNHLLVVGFYLVNIGFVSPYFFWYAAVTLIVLGHVIAVYIAHVAALRVFKNRQAALVSQIPMVALMVAYTMVSLWILAQPIVG